MKFKNIIWLLLAGVVVGGLVLFSFLPSQIKNREYLGKVIVYKSPTCGCCVSYISLLEQRGYDVETVVTEDMTVIKDKYKIPKDMESCHTAVYGDYIVEGHVPFDVMEKFLAERPEGVYGIALPDMPAGSPGMPGDKVETFNIYSLSQAGPEIYVKK